MIRIISIFIGLAFTAAVLWAFGNGAFVAATQGLGEKTADRVFHTKPHAPEGGFSFDGPVGRFDRQQLQRGYQVYKEVCSACHSLKFVAFRDLAQLGYNEAEIKAEAASWQVPGIDPDTGEATTRAGQPTDRFPSPFANAVAAAAANNNAVPPDLSLMTKARHDGPAYVYSLVSGYGAPDPALRAEFPQFETPTGLYFNKYFATLNLAMAPPLTSAGQVTYADGTEATIPQMAADVAAFLAWTAEPTMEQRKQTGVWFLGFMIFVTLLAFLSKKQVWSALHGRRKD